MEEDQDHDDDTDQFSQDKEQNLARRNGKNSLDTHMMKNFTDYKTARMTLKFVFVDRFINKEILYAFCL